MTRTIFTHLDKTDLTYLPIETCRGEIITILTAGEAERAVNYLLQSDILGVDTETKPSFQKGVKHKVALLQVANRTTCFLFRLNEIGITPAIKRLLEDKTVKKVGLSWHDDIHALEEREQFTPGWFLDIQDLVKHLGIQDMSLQKIYANLFHKKISKRQRLTNWEATVLTEKQKKYAALDAFACIKLFDEIMKLYRNGNYKLVDTSPKKEEEPEKSVESEKPKGTDEPKKTEETKNV